jgi:hypothetical protein
MVEWDHANPDHLSDYTGLLLNYGRGFVGVDCKQFTIHVKGDFILVMLGGCGCQSRPRRDDGAPPARYRR